MKYEYNDGGRSKYFKGEARDCACRSISIAAEIDYKEVYNSLAEGMKLTSGKKSARNGIFTNRKWFKNYMEELGFKWMPTMKIGIGCTTHLRKSELPDGRLVVRCSKHLTCVIDGVIYDTHNPSRGGSRCVYGYWKLN